MCYLIISIHYCASMKTLLFFYRVQMVLVEENLESSKLNFFSAICSENRTNIDGIMGLRGTHAENAVRHCMRRLCDQIYGADEFLESKQSSVSILPSAESVVFIFSFRCSIQPSLLLLLLFSYYFRLSASRLSIDSFRFQFLHSTIIISFLVWCLFCVRAADITVNIDCDVCK